MKYTLLLACLIILFTSSCKKWQKQYPEDTEKTKLTPAERITGKLWKLSKVTLNGFDYTDSVKNKIGNFKFQLSTQLMPLEDDLYSGYADSDNEGSYGTFWYFYNDESCIFQGRISTSIPPQFRTIIISPNYFYYENTGFMYQCNKILKLTDNELKISIQNAVGDSIIVNEFTN